MSNKFKEFDFGKSLGINVLVMLSGLFVILLLFSFWFTVGAGQRGVLMDFGAVQHEVLEPGLHFKIPFVQSYVLMDVQVQKAETIETAFSKDLQSVQTKMAINWHIDPKDAEWVYQNVGREDSLVQRILQPAVSNAVKSVTAQYNAEDLVARRDIIRAQIEQHVQSSVKNYRILVDNANIVDFEFSAQYANAIEQKQVAQQHAQQAQYDLQKAQVVAQQKVVEAEAQSKAQALLKETITPIIVQQEAIAKWDGHLPKVIGGSGVIPMIGNMDSNKAN